MPINRYEWVGSGTMVGFRGEIVDTFKPTFGQTGSGLFAITGGAAESFKQEYSGRSGVPIDVDLTLFDSIPY